MVEVAGMRERRRAERERISREEALRAAQSAFFADQLSQIGCSCPAPGEEIKRLSALLRRIRDFHYRLDWPNICRRAAGAQRHATVPEALAKDAGSPFRAELERALRDFSGLRELRPYHFLAALVREIRTAV